MLLRCALVIALAATVGAQDRPRSSGPEQWLAAVREHTPGRDDLSVSRLQAWSLNDLQGALKGFRKLVSREDADAILKKAAVLHTDIAMFRRRPGGYNLPTNGRPSLMIRDGEAFGNSSGTYHWEFARSCLDALRSDVSTDTFAQRWYVAVAATLQQTGDYTELQIHLAKGLSRFSGDATLLFYDGAMHEAYAAPHLLLSFREQDQAPASFGRRASTAASPLRSEIKDRGMAEYSFRRALKADPTLAEARIRLAQILEADEKHDDAVVALQRALEGTLAPRLEYWGRLLLGRAEHARDHLAAAAAAFERARALFPKAPSPVLALSQVARDRGDRVTASRLLSELPDVRSLVEADEPWWTYFWTHEPDATTLGRALWTSLGR